MANRASLIDLSKWNGSWNPDKAERPIDGVILRASYGLMPDRKFLEFSAAAQSIFVRGAYHYFSSGSPWSDQADFFLSQIEGQRMQFVVCDFEAGYNAMSVKFALEARLWLEYVAAQSRLPALLYTNTSTYQDYVAPSGDWANNWKLWIAQYPYRMWNEYLERISAGNTIQPWMPRGRTDWSLWQYSADGNLRGSLYGVASNSVDLNVYNGTVEDMINDLGLNITDLGNGYGEVTAEARLQTTLTKMQKVIDEA